MALKLSHDAFEPGHAPDFTTLDEEGCGDLTSAKFIETWCRHFLAWLNIWQDDGFAPVSKSWIFRADGREEDCRLNYEDTVLCGRVEGLDKSGNLILKMNDSKVRTLYLKSVIKLHDSAL